MDACVDGLKVGTHVLLPSARHEILQETDPIRLRFWVAFDAYIGLGWDAATAIEVPLCLRFFPVSSRPKRWRESGIA